MRLIPNRLLFLTCVLAALLWSCDRNSTRADAEGSQPQADSQAPDSPADGAQNGDAQNEQGEVCQLIEDGFGPSGQTQVRAEEVASGLEVPWGVLFMEGGDMLVTERAGQIRLVRDGQLVDEPVANVDVTDTGEGGLLDIQPHPEFANNRQFYLYMTADSDGETINRVELWQLSQDAQSLGANRQEVIVDDIPAAAFHNGGRMRVGPDGMLYIGTGDARDPDLSQDEDSLAGKILRVTPEGDAAQGNPFDNRVFITGIRNTQGFDWRDESTLLVSDHGPSGEMGRSGHDEVSVAQAGTNLGWPTIYGCETQEGLRAPSISWETAVPPGGAARYTGDAISQWQGSLLVGTLGSKHLHRIVFEEGSRRVAQHETYFEGDPPEGLGRLREVIMGPDGHLYVTTSNCDGRGNCPDDGDKIYRIVPE